MSDTPMATLRELRVLHGPQAGSRLPLAAGEYALGSSDECAVILSGPGVRDMHATLTVSDAGLRIRPEEGAVDDAMGHSSTTEMALSPGVPLALGGVWIAVDDPAAPWPDAQALASMLQPAPPSAGAPASAVAEASASASTDSEDEPVDGAGQEAAPSAAALPRRSGRRVVRSVSLAVVIAAVASSAYALAAWLDRPASAAAGGKGSAASAASASAAAVASAPSASSTSSAASEPAAGGAGTRPDDQLLSDAQDYLAQHANDFDGALLHAEADRPGTLRLTGAARDDKVVAQAATALKAAVPGLRNVVADVKGPAELVRDFRDVVSAAGLGDRVAIIQETPVLLVEGNLDPADRARWEAVLGHFAAVSGSALPFWAWIRPQPAPARSLPFGIRTVVGGPMPYIITDQGERAAPGARIGGRKLTAISDAEVVFDGNDGTHITR